MLYYEYINKQMVKYIDIKSIDTLTNNLNSLISSFRSVFLRKCFLVFASPPAQTHTHTDAQIYTHTHRTQTHPH